MSALSDQIFHEATNLDPEERAELIDRLFHSFDENQDDSIENAWRDEVLNRHEAHNAGILSSDSMENVLSRLS